MLLSYYRFRLWWRDNCCCCFTFTTTTTVSRGHFRRCQKCQHTLDQSLIIQPLNESIKYLLFVKKLQTVRIFCLFSVPSTQVISLSSRSITALVAMWVSSSPVKPSFTLMYSMTCRHVYWYEYQFCTSVQTDNNQTVDTTVQQ
jgi:hypothetical protein